MFEIYLGSSGPVILTDDAKIKVMGSVVSGNRTFSDVQRDTGLAKSSTSVTLSRLVSDGMLTVEDRFGEKRYEPDAVRVVMSVDPDRAPIIDTVRIRDVVGKDAMERFVLSYMVMSARKYGFTVAPVMIEISRIHAKVAFESAEDRSLEGAIDGITDYFRRSEFADVTCVSKIPMAFDIVPRFRSSESTIHTFSEMVMRFIVEYISLITSTRYFVSDITEFGDEFGGMRMVLGFDEAEKEYGNCGFHDLEIDPGCRPDFEIYKAREGGYVPVIGELEMGIMDSLSRRRRTSRELSDETGSPQSTVITHLNRMQEAGIICSEKRGNRSVYQITSDKAVGWRPPDRTYSERGRRYLEDAWKDPSHALRGYMAFIILDSYYIGFDINTMLRFAGWRAAEIICRNNPGRSADELFRTISADSERITSSKIVLKSYNPITMVRLAKYDMECEIAEAQRDLYESVFLGILKITTGADYVVRGSEIYGQGNRGLEMSFAPRT